MAFDITPYIDMKPSEVRKLIREGVIERIRHRAPRDVSDDLKAAMV